MNASQQELDEDAVYCIASGIVHCSVCVPAGMSREAIERKVNEINPAGIESRWAISEDKNFATGQTNPCVCEQNNSRMHYLMVC